MKEVAESDQRLRILANDQVKIQPQTSDKYTQIIDALKKIIPTEFHTYQFKKEINFKVVLKGIHYSTETEEIKTAIKQLGHMVASVST